MTDYTELIRSLRNCSNNRCTPCDCEWFNKYQVDESCKEIIMWKAAAAIEALLKENKELIEDHPEMVEDDGHWEWRKSNGEVLMPKRGEWKPFDLTYGRSIYSCSVCEQATEVPMCMEKPMYAYCPNCGAKMEVHDG